MAIPRSAAGPIAADTTLNKLAEGEPEYDDLEKRLAEGPVITNGAPRCQFLAKKFAGKYWHRIIKGGVGHNLPQEARRPLPKPSSTRRKAAPQSQGPTRIQRR